MPSYDLLGDLAALSPWAELENIDCFEWVVADRQERNATVQAIKLAVQCPPLLRSNLRQDICLQPSRAAIASTHGKTSSFTAEVQELSYTDSHQYLVRSCTREKNLVV